MVVAALSACAVCGLETAYPLRGARGQSFCCPACQEVAQLLQDEPAPPAATFAGTGQQVTISLAGLWCSSCGWLIEKRLQRAPGVQSAEVSFGRREARVTIDPQVTNPSALARLVRRLGYRAWLPGERPRDDEEDLFNRLLISGVFVMHDMVVGLMIYARDWLGWSSPDSAWLVTIFYVMMLLGAIPVLVLLGLPVIRAGMASLLRGRPTIHTLIAIGALAAIVLSTRNVLLNAGGVYFDTASMLLFLVSIGRWLEMQAQKAGAGALEELWRKIPREAIWLSAEGERRVVPEDLPKGARVRVEPGQHFPVDGVVVLGIGDVDESLLTGEPAPVLRQPGDRVMAGTSAVDSAFEVVTLATGSQTQAGKIGRLLHEALWRRAPLERLADRLAALMIPAAVMLALATFAFWTMRSGAEVGLLNALAVLLIACPCALGIATPLSFWLALGRAAQAGVLLRGTAALEALAQVRTIFFDKTGTLTRQPPHVLATVTKGITADDFLRTVAAVESGSTHPLAQAVLDAVGNMRLPAATNARAWPGLGVSAEIDHALVWVGSRRFMEQQGLELPPDLAEAAARWQENGASLLFAGWDGCVFGLVAVGESARPEAAAVVQQLRDLGLDVAILTGDDQAAGMRWQKRLSIPVYADLRPKDKLDLVQSSAGPVAMVGDGINDGPALAQAQVGIAMGHGIDVARSAADMILLRDDLRVVPWLVVLSRRALLRVRQNLVWAFVYNLVGLALAMAGLLQPALAALAMIASSAFVIGNALRLRREPLPEWLE
ncbi:MAG: carbonate dehydratase [Herpetosiphonaceae bacterium]|nr:MAG: carbonate dehydratase [Herpetosiphonaceae bacterium]